ncbi:MAG: hypothetical protein PHV13_03010 [Candidatus ainarchaeum sp.]|nr:hypothetical protein [Candidatus ainarchaeum sp.]
MNVPLRACVAALNNVVPHISPSNYSTPEKRGQLAAAITEMVL